jgi:hypothetical protein
MMVLQVAAVVLLGAHGDATIPIRNPARESLTVTVALFHGDTVAGQVRLGSPVVALISPDSVTLAPGERQVVRLRVRESLVSGTVLRLVTTWTPLAKTAAPSVSETTAVARLIMVTRLISKVMVP